MAIIEHQKFYRDLDAKKLSPVYFLFGDEPYLLDQSFNRFKYGVLDESSMDFNFSLYYAKDAEVSQIRDVVETLPAFAPMRVVILKNVQDFKEKELLELEPLVKNPVTSTVFVIFADKIDKRKRIFKSFIDSAVSIEFKKPYDNQVPQWIRHIATTLNLKISNDAINRLHRLAGNNLSEIEGHLIRVQAYAAPRASVELDDINAVVSVSREENIFDFTEALGGKDKVNALEQLVNLLDQGQAPQAIIGAVARHIRILLNVRAGMDQGIGGAKLANLVGLSPYFIETYCDQARLWSVKKLEDMLVVLHETDKALKSTTGASSHIWLENLVLKSCSL